MMGIYSLVYHAPPSSMKKVRLIPWNRITADNVDFKLSPNHATFLLPGVVRKGPPQGQKLQARSQPLKPDLYELSNLKLSCLSPLARQRVKILPIGIYWGIAQSTERYLVPRESQCEGSLKHLSLYRRHTQPFMAIDPRSKWIRVYMPWACGVHRGTISSSRSSLFGPRVPLIMGWLSWLVSVYFIVPGITWAYHGLSNYIVVKNG